MHFMKLRLQLADTRGFRVVMACTASMTVLALPLAAQTLRRADYREIYVSPDVKSHQGYATDGTNHYTFDNTTIYKWAADQKWSLMLSNNAPFAGLDGLNHFGDGDYFEGKLYIVAEFWGGCEHYTNQSITVFDAATLRRLEVHSVSAQGHEVAGLAVAPSDGPGGMIYVASYCDGGKLFKYDLRTFEFAGVLPLSRPLANLQGVAWHAGQFYAPVDGGDIYTFDSDGRVRLLYHDTHIGSHEGLKYAGLGLRWLIDEGPGKQRVHYISAMP